MKSTLKLQTAPVSNSNLCENLKVLSVAWEIEAGPSRKWLDICGLSALSSPLGKCGSGISKNIYDSSAVGSLDKKEVYGGQK